MVSIDDYNADNSYSHDDSDNREQMHIIIRQGKTKIKPMRVYLAQG